MARSRAKTSAFKSDESLKAALKKAGATQSTPAGHSSALAAALKRVSENASPTADATLKTALERVGTQSTLAGHSGALAAALKKVSESNNHPPNPSLQAAFEATRGRGPQQDDLLKAVQEWSHAYAHSKGKTCPNLGGGLKGFCKGVEAGREAGALGFRAGLRGSMHLGLDARLTLGDLTLIPVNEALAGDWKRTERDLWTSIERVTRQLEELPEPTQSRLRSVLIRRLASGRHRA